MTERKILALILIAVWIATVFSGCALPMIQPEMQFGFDRAVSETEQALRLQVVETAQTWLGASNGSTQHRQILSIYNAHKPLAQNYTVQESDKWCATFVSAVAIACNLTDLIPTECGCQRQIGLFADLGRWQEDDTYIPLPGDIIYYCSNDTAPDDDCTGWSDHVGIVVGTCNGYIKVIEGNYNGKVAYHIIQVNSAGIRGYALPDYSAAQAAE